MSDDRDWTEIDPKFGEIRENYIPIQIYQELWEANHLTYEDAVEWINAGWEVGDCYWISEWINYNFTVTEANEWRNVGLEKNDYEIAVYARWKNYTPAQFKDRIEELRTEYEQWKKTPQLLTEYIDLIYPQRRRARIKNLMIDKEQNIDPSSELIINGQEWKSLWWIVFSNIQFKSLSLINCGQLTTIHLLFCDIESDLAIFSQLVNLERLGISENNFTGNLSSLSNLVNLKWLELQNNLQLTGSLQSLQSLTKLRQLNITNTNINEGLEYLPESLKYLFCDTEENSNIQSKFITKLIGDSWVDWREANKELLQLFSTNDELIMIHSEIVEFFRNHKDFVSQYQEIATNERRISYTEHSQKVTSFIAVFGTALGGYYSIPGGWTSAGAGLAGMITSYLANNYFEKRKKVIENKWGNTETRREITIDNFIQESVELENLYRRLEKIFKHLELLSNQPSKSEALNKAFTNFLDAMQECKEAVNKSLSTNEDLEAGRREAIVVNFVSNFPIDSLDQSLKNLIRIIYNHRKEMYHPDQIETTAQIVEIEGDIPLQTLNVN